MRDDKERLLDILEAIDKIESHIQDRNTLEKNELLQVWTVHHIQIIGEASARLSEDLRINHSEIPWVEIIAMRNIIVHRYFLVDTNEIWNTVKHDLPKLKDDIQRILHEYKSS
jgi:uncharacterized protein with HEPN domain